MVQMFPEEYNEIASRSSLAWVVGIPDDIVMARDDQQGCSELNAAVTCLVGVCCRQNLLQAMNF